MQGLEALASLRERLLRDTYDKWSAKQKGTTLVHWGFDVTDFGERWPFVVRELGLHLLGQHETCFVWINEHGLEFCTQNNPDDGTYIRPVQRTPQRGFASYIGISAPQVELSHCLYVIRRYALLIKGESPNKRGFI